MSKFLQFQAAASDEYKRAMVDLIRETPEFEWALEQCRCRGVTVDPLRVAQINALCDVSTLIRETPARCNVFGFTAPITQPFLRHPTRDGIPTRCALHRYHDGACSFSVLGVGLEDAE